ncbi:MAG: type II toxin-antitoxin system RelE/ParE family toxin [Nitrososphaerota archaeon]|nr:type II toxin-antitoxin system RelE/ParE family toxin [Nitrososphaerota archaeon]
MPSSTVIVSKRAEKQFFSLPKDAQDRVFCALRILQNEGLYGKLDIQKLQGASNFFRIRVGTYRILFELYTENAIKVYAILPRKNAYKL